MASKAPKRKQRRKPKPKTRSSRFFTKQHLAEHLGLSIYTIDAWVSERREIPFIKMGTRVLFERKDIEVWISKNKKRPRKLVKEPEPGA